MAEGKRSELTQLVMDIADAMLLQYDALVEEWGKIPFLQEEVSRTEYQRRFRAMTQEQRLVEVQRIGVPEILRLMGRAHA